MDIDSMRNPTCRKEIREAWEEGWEMSTDPVIGWEMAWGRAREKFKKFHKEDREKISKLKAQKEALGEIRERIQSGASENEIEEYRVKEKEVHDAKILEASILRRRSRVHWTTEGDTNIKYFFNCLKSKQKQEKITSLMDDEGHIVEDEERMLTMVHEFYQRLYQQHPEQEGDRENRKATLELLDKELNAEDNKNLVELPCVKEITELVNNLPKEKAPGEDGLSTEEEVRYLGCLVGSEVGEDNLQHDLVEKFSKKLTHWTTRFLSWPSRITLARHVLRALPNYQLIGLGIHEIGFKALEALCRKFIWGTGVNGQAKTTLVAWHRTTTQKCNGGLGLRTFRDTADILKMRYIARLLQGENTEWATMIKFLIHHEMKKQAKGREYRWCTVEEGMLLLKTIPTPKNLTVCHFMLAWKRFRKFLTLDDSSWSLSGSLTVSQFSLLTKLYGNSYKFNDKALNPLLKGLRVTVLVHLQDQNGRWRDI
ncbi:hypothetical protein R1sor_012130 [Riccia sorocarpa]|uniref:Uncharacterized protein n=1 Tax=Riccia sorocarpa TaxID=122646 RepID=A0ABD3I689_9MARC